jgi:hypothetical protein
MLPTGATQSQPAGSMLQYLKKTCGWDGCTGFASQKKTVR